MKKTQTIYNRCGEDISLRRYASRFVLGTLLAAACAVVYSNGAQAFSNQPFGKELSKYVENGKVKYAKWKKKPEALKDYLDSLANLSEQDYEGLSPEEQKALWLNAYNALTIKLVLDNYPIHGTNPDFPPDSFRQIPDAWESIQFKVAGRAVTLDEIEHTILRRDFHDPRTHFVIVCAAEGSPHLLNHELCGKNLEAELDHAKTVFLNDEQNISFNTQTHVLNVSKIFQWFPLDFACAEWFKRNKGKLPSEESVIVEYLQKHGSEKLKQELKTATEPAIHVDYKNFNWSLNQKM